MRHRLGELKRVDAGGGGVKRHRIGIGGLSRWRGGRSRARRIVVTKVAIQS
jgi:hypothetical protein